MSGTSGDGVDASVINSDGEAHYRVLINKYFQYSEEISQNIYKLKRNINKIEDVKKFIIEINDLERKITLFHSNVVSNIIKDNDFEIDLVGFHGQTILHSPKQKYSKQLGDGNLLSQLLKKKIIYNFRQNDLLNGGEGAPLSPIFHQTIIKQKRINPPVCILNIGGISNMTIINDFNENNLISRDIGPGNCLIDEWIRKNTNERFDKDGLIGKSGNINQIILNQAIENFNFISYNKSLDIKDFDISFARGLSIKDGCATITNFTAYLISEGIKFSQNRNNNTSSKYLVCGGGRKNIHLIESIKQYVRNNHQISIDLIDQFNYDGDFIESQAFGYLAIRSFLKLPITFPSTTGCCSPLSGGIVTENF